MERAPSVSPTVTLTGNRERSGANMDWEPSYGQTAHAITATTGWESRAGLARCTTLAALFLRDQSRQTAGTASAASSYRGDLLTTANGQETSLTGSGCSSMPGAVGGQLEKRSEVRWRSAGAGKGAKWTGW